MKTNKPYRWMCKDCKGWFLFAIVCPSIVEGKELCADCAMSIQRRELESFYNEPTEKDCKCDYDCEKYYIVGDKENNSDCDSDENDNCY